MIGYTKLLALLPFFQLALLAATGTQATITNQPGNRVAKQCKRQLDFSIVVDESASISLKHWQEQMIPFLRNLIRTIDLDKSDIRLSLTTFSTPVRQIFDFLDEAASNTKLALEKLERMSETRPSHGMTFTGKALHYVRKAVLPYGRKNVPKALLVITDGGSSDADHTAQAAALLRDEGVNVMVIGVGDVNIFECRGMVGCDGVMDCPMFKHTNWADMINLFYGLMKEVCDTLPQDAECQPIWSEWSECDAECNASGIRTRSLIDLKTIKAAVNGTNGQLGRTCVDQKSDFPPQAVQCTGDCEKIKEHKHDLPPPRIEGDKGEVGGATDLDKIPTEVPQTPNAHDEEPHSDDDEDFNTPYSPHEQSTPPSQPDVHTTDLSKIDEYETTTDTAEATPEEDGLHGTGSEREERLKEELERQRELEREKEEAMKQAFEKSLEEQREKEKQEEEERRLAYERTIYEQMEREKKEEEERRLAHERNIREQLEKQKLQMEDEMKQAYDRTLYEQSESAKEHGGDVVHTGGATGLATTGASSVVHDAALQPRTDTQSVKGADGVTAQDNVGNAENQEGDKGRSTSNTTKIAGGALLGLLLVGAGGGYAMYKKNKVPPMDLDPGDYAGADESVQPMKDAETYTVTEFDNNIWGEAA
uniref:Thrombospondin-related anonymous protein n=1 Tax=Babesia sp. TaxID=35084 RepID=A0A221SSH1_9APIC|nr:thrombospondin-related anonymous protein [Babesia sp.]ASN79591.1 thrombospondin-related anonymous protein [Babesia sp.]ASN79593.1 thrombospondin-related anonymous protein [Babesia sp.]